MHTTPRTARPLVFLVAALATATAAAAADWPRLSLTIYSAGDDALFAASAPDAAAPGGYAVVRDRRSFDLKSGRNAVDVHDLSRFLDPAALTAHAVAGGDTVIVSQRFVDETLSFDALVQRHVGHPVEIAAGSGATAAVVAGTLLSNNGGLTVQGADGRVTTVTEFSRVTFPGLPAALAATPSLHWDLEAKKAGTQSLEIVYPTQGLGWRAEYSGWLANGDCRLTLAGWAQIANRSGAEFSAARVKLVAGSPHRAAAPPPPNPRMRSLAAAATLQAPESGNVGDYHEYTLDAPVDLAGGSLLRAALFPEQAIPCKREYVFEGSTLRANPGMAPITDRNYGNEPDAGPVRSTLSFKTDRALPAGRLRVLQEATDGTAEFVGEDDIAHTPRGDTLSLQLGEAFDLRGERRQTNFQVDKERRTLDETFSIRLVNGGAGAQTVVVREHLYRWTQWNIAQASAKYAKRDADSVDFSVDVPANGNATLTYTVQYQWSESFK
jgi:hypothetical protein